MLQDKINSMIMTSMKSGEKEKAETYRLIKAKLLEAKTATLFKSCLLHCFVEINN